MRIVVAPDSFKGSVSAVETANAIEQGIKSVFSEAEVIKVPMGDGGEGTVEALVTATNGKIMYQNVMGPLGTSVKSFWGILGDGETAVIEMAAASGLPLVPEEKKDPRITTTYGTGELIRAALEHGMKKIIVGIGGSATNDAGCGMMQALGGRFLDDAGRELPQGGAALIKLAAIDLSQLDVRLRDTEIIVACDVDNPLCGEKVRRQFMDHRKERHQNLSLSWIKRLRILLRRLKSLREKRWQIRLEPAQVGELALDFYFLRMLCYARG